jgi:DNA (cytosine-5)-methyltransferase 1
MPATALQYTLDAPSGSWRSFEIVDGELRQELATSSLIAARTCRLPDIDPADPLGTWWSGYLWGTPLVPVVPNRTLRSVDLFCGAGGLSLGFARACEELGFAHESIAAADSDAGALNVFALNQRPDVATPGSVAGIVDYQIRDTRDGPRFLFQPTLLRDAWHELRGYVDVVLAGPPCQGHSNLNNQSRRFDPRNRLYLAVPALAVALEAPIVIIENVPDVVNDHHGVVDTTCEVLQHHGYSVTTGVLAADRLGWPQTRRRFFLVARRDVPPLELGAVAHGLAHTPRSVMWALKAPASDDDATYMLETPELSEESRRRIDWLFDNDEFDLALSERPDCHRDGTTYKNVYGRMRPDEPAPTLTTGFVTAGRGRFVHPTERRVLNAREAARIQGFPDTYRFAGPDGATPARKCLAKWIGDAVPMPLGFAAGVAALGSRFSSIDQRLGL